ncbi:CocE/NonD family hydrolase [Leucobacter allii]|uniref:CocE/NonD family hydrolase n=1 Tax=Leucobacter allii TaxID=2932247 RepID=A0ABY4FH21_9MICO|nr:CocE/NonD family hydrolase [Leucobacter allii]UOQ55939.1 CocE/NonD family hydrolase [Leucobacter allii]
MSVSRPEPAYRVLRDLAVPLRDGARLATDVYLPEGGGPWPVLLARTPYGKGDVFQSQFILSMQFADAITEGFAVVIQDTRGRGGSEGSFTPFADERDDGYDTLEWIVSQSFSDGNVVMFGASYVGATQWAAAASGHPALRAIAPVLTSPRFREDWVLPGGAFHLAFQLQWAFEALAPVEAQRRDWDGAGAGAAAALLREMRRDPASAFARRPLLDETLLTVAPYFGSWLRRPGEPQDRLPAGPALPDGSTPLPALHVIGWNDLFAHGGLRAFERAIAPGAPAAEHQYLIAGPWSHGNMSDWQGDTWHGYDSSGAGADVQGDQLRLAAAVVAGERPDLPRVRYFTSGINRWRTSETWPLEGIGTREFRLRADGALRSPDAPPGAEDVDARPDPAVDRWIAFTSDPENPVPSVGGPSFLPGLLQGRNSGPMDQREVESRDDVLLFTSQPLPAPMQVTGIARLDFWGACDREDCDWSVRLCDVDAAGVSRVIADGHLRSRFRDAHERGLEPGVPERFSVELSPTSHVFASGHRLRLQITGSNFPRYDVNPHRMVPIPVARPHDYVRATQHVVIAPGREARLLLPVLTPER